MTVAALVCAALAAWASGGSLTVLPFQSGGPRAGLVPSLLWLAIAIVTALILTRTLSPAAGKRARVWLLSALVLLPWLPVRIPSSFLIWVGPIRFWVLAILAIATTVSTLAQRAPPLLRAAAADPRRAPWLAGAVAASLYVAGAWAVSPHLPAGDEPHYLVITQSLLNDGDLKVENNYLRREYREYYAGDLQPHYLRRGLNQAIYSIHAPGLPAVVAPVFALFGYPGVIVFLALASAAATALTWTTVWRVTRDVAASWFGWSAVALSAPFFFQAFTVYPDAPGGALLMVTVLALVSDDEPSTAYLVACGASLALLPWLHTRFALLAATAGLALALRAMRAERPVRRIAALLAVPAISALTWFAFFYVVYGTIDPSAPYNGYTQTSWANLGRGVPGLLLDQQFGLLPNAPVYLCAALGLVPLARRSPRLAAELTAIAVPYVLAVAAYQMWWAGYSSPARFLTPILLPLAIPAGLWFAALRSWAARMLGLTAVAVSLLITVTVATVERGSLLFNTRDGASRLLVWMSPLVNLTTGMPSLFQNSPLAALVHGLVWLLAIAMTTAVAIFAGRGPLKRSTVILMTGVAGAASAMLALSVVWRSNGAEPSTPASASASLRRDFSPGTTHLGVRYAPFRILGASDVVMAATRGQWPGTARSLGEPFVSLQYPLAATYELVATIARPGAGRLSVVLDREFGAAWSWTIPGEPGEWRQTFTLPTPATGMLVDADLATKRAIDHLELRPVHLLDNGGVANLRPVHTIRYGPAVVLLLSGHVYVERGGAWLAGGSEADFAIQPDPGHGIRLFLRNAPIDNRISLQSGTWRQDIDLKPREERLLDVPVDPATGAARLRTSCRSGVRPSEVEHSDDTRLLGCWIETR